MVTNCLECKKEFQTYPSRIKIGWDKFCSNKCRGQTLKGKHISPKTEFKKGEYNGCGFRKGEKNPLWCGDDTCYRSLHRWVYKQLGKADHCSNQNCVYPRKGKNGRLMLTPKRYEWSNISQKYKQDISDWQQLCVSCHHLYDNML